MAIGMTIRDLRDFISVLEKEDELIRVKKEVESGEEISTIIWEINNRLGPAVLFEKVKGYKYPVFANGLGTARKFALSLGWPKDLTLKQLRDKYIPYLNPKTWIKPKLVSDGPCKEVVVKEKDVDLYEFPILKWMHIDSAPYITMPSIVAKDPSKGVNVGMYRMQLIDKRTTGLMCNVFQDIGIFLARAAAAGKKEMEVAVTVGVSPATYIATTTKLPFGACEFDLAGALQGEPIELVKCETVDLEVPARSELVIEGTVKIGERVEAEGPFSEWHGYWEEPMSVNLFKVKCITHRKDMIYQVCMESHPESEGEMLRFVQQLSTFHVACQQRVKGFVDSWLPPKSRGFKAVVSIKKRYPGWGKQALYQTFGAPYVGASVNYVVVVDGDIDVTDDEQVEWAVSTRVDAERDVVITPPQSTYPLNPAARSRSDGAWKTTDFALCSKWGVDATLKTRGEGYERPTPIPTVPTKEMLDKVKERWREYGFR